jgi:4-diphosphocytidyl-2-C-methyl-D-erythritol kinase
MIVFPKAKINIGLRITGKRTDGFHNIETIFYPVNLSDALEFAVSDEETDKDSLTVTGINTGCAPYDNLVMKVVRKLREKFTFPVLKIHLHKAIPSGAGLGGGSSDAAFLLRALDRHYNLDAGTETFMKIALELGSDCPFFIDAIPSYATGRGEILTPAGTNLSSFYLILLNPGVGIDTSEAYRNCRPEQPSDDLLAHYNSPVDKWKDLIFNDFEEFAFRKYPLIGELKSRLYQTGALFSSMSGSGSSVFGIFRSKPLIPDKLKDYIIWEGML